MGNPAFLDGKIYIDNRRAVKLVPEHLIYQVGGGFCGFLMPPRGLLVPIGGFQVASSGHQVAFKWLQVATRWLLSGFKWPPSGF